MNIFIETFRRYMKKPKTSFALHLDGPWGSGKTHFIKQQIRGVVESEFSEFRLVYISLNGIKDLNEIGENVFLQIISPNAAKGYVFARGAVNIFKHLIPNASEMDLTTTDERIQEFIRNKKMDNLLLCIDDLERIDNTLPIESVLGYINTNFIEHNHVKTILISNSNEIHSESFDRIKEKVIGRTFTFSIENVNVIFEIVKTDYPTLYPFFQENIDTLSVMIESIEDLNLRSIQFACDIAYEVFDSIKVLELSNAAYLNVFTFILVVSLEYRKGTIRTVAEAIEMFDPLNAFSHLGDGTKVVKPLSNLVLKDQYRYFPSLLEFIVLGHFNTDRVKQEINLKYKHQSEEIRSYEVVKYYYNYEIQKVKASLDTVLAAIRKGYYNPEDYPVMYMELKQAMESCGVASANLFDEVQNGLILSMEGKSEHLLEIAFISQHYYSGITDENSKSLHGVIKTRIAELQDEESVKNIKMVVSDLARCDVARIHQHLKYLRNTDKFFKSLDQISFYEQLVTMHNHSITLFKILLHEMFLTLSNAAEFHHEEIPFIHSLKHKLTEQVLHIEADVLKRGLIGEVINDLDKVIDHLTPKKE